MEKDFEDKRSEPRTVVDQYYSVEFSVKDIDSVYQFRIWNTSAKGICVLVKEGSALLKFLKVGEVLNMKYYKTDAPESSDTINTEIRHITRDDDGRFKGHYLIGLSILEKS